VSDDTGISIPDQIKAAKRELAMRKNVYPKWVASGRMKQATADHEIAAMTAIIATLEGVVQSKLL
jgi:hypothetical protein